MPRKYPDTVLVLNLHRKWFDMILRGEKIEEYREITPYWLGRFFTSIPKSKENRQKVCDAIVKIASHSLEELDLAMDEPDMHAREYTHVHFDNGMKPDYARPQINCKIARIEVGYGQEKWGAEPGKLYFIIHLNGVVNAKNV